MLRKMWLPTFIILLTLVNLSTIIVNHPFPALAQEGISVQATLGTTFTYQGRLTDANSPVSATCDFQFSLFDAASGGSQVSACRTHGASPRAGSRPRCMHQSATAASPSRMSGYAGMITWYQFP